MIAAFGGVLYNGDVIDLFCGENIMYIVSSQKIQAQFGEIADRVKSHEPVVITQSGRPTMMLVNYDEGMAAMRQYHANQFCAFLNERARHTPPASYEELAEISRLIEEEREAIYQENLKQNAQ